MIVPTTPDPTSTHDEAHADSGSPPAPPRELSHDDAPAERRFEAGGRTWIARLAGRGAAGTGAYGLGLIEAVHFYDAAAPDRPLREALLARGRFAGLFDSELVELLGRATTIVVPDER